MAAVLLSLHVIAAIVLVGPVTVAVSAFPRFARMAASDDGSSGARAVAGYLHRVTRVYSVLSIAVPVFGLATAIQLGVLGDLWITASIAITLGAAAVLIFRVLPGQREVMASLPDDPVADDPVADVAPGGTPTNTDRTRCLGMNSGVFSLLWATVVVLMIVRPGSTTGV